MGVTIFMCLIATREHRWPVWLWKVSSESMTMVHEAM